MVRPEGIEPPTLWFVASGYQMKFINNQSPAMHRCDELLPGTATNTRCTVTVWHVSVTVDLSNKKHEFPWICIMFAVREQRTYQCNQNKNDCLWRFIFDAILNMTI